MTLVTDPRDMCSEDFRGSLHQAPKPMGSQFVPKAEKTRRSASHLRDVYSNRESPATRERRLKHIVCEKPQLHSQPWSVCGKEVPLAARKQQKTIVDERHSKVSHILLSGKTSRSIESIRIIAVSTCLMTCSLRSGTLVKTIT